MTTVHKAVIGIRSSVKGLDRDALGSFASGEENIVKQYDDALGQDDIHEETVDLLGRQRAALLTKIDEMRALGR